MCSNFIVDDVKKKAVLFAGNIWLISTIYRQVWVYKTTEENSVIGTSIL